MSTTPRRFPQQIFITNSTNSSNVVTGSLVTSGGLGVASNLSIGGSSFYFGGNANYSGLTAPSTNPASNVLLRLPNALPVNSGSFLQSDTSGNLSFATGVMNTFSIGTTIPSSGTITGLSYTTGQFDIIVTVQITGGSLGNLTQLFRLTGILSNLTGTGWTMSSIGVSGDNTQFAFNITATGGSAGQINYTASGSYGTVTSAIISWTNFQSFPNATGLSTIGGNIGIKVYYATGTLSGSSDTAVQIAFPLGVTNANIISISGVAYNGTLNATYPNGMTNTSLNSLWDIYVTSTGIQILTGAANNSDILSRTVNITIICNS